MRTLIFVSILSLVACYRFTVKSKISPKYPHNLVLTQNSLGYVLNENISTLMIYGLANRGDSTWYLDTTDAIEFEKLFQNSQFARMFRFNSNQYVRQYLGVKRENSEYLIVINFYYFENCMAARKDTLNSFVNELAIRDTEAGYNYFYEFNIKSKKITLIR